MKSLTISNRFLSLFTILFPCLAALFSFWASPAWAEPRQVEVSWQYDFQGSGLAGFKLYHQNVKVCEVADPAARVLTCQIDLLTGDNVFNLTAFDSGGTESAKSTPYTFNYSPNTAPVATPFTINLAEDGSAATTLSATDANNDPLTFSIVTNPAHGSVNLTNPTTGAFTYTPAANYNGPDSFTFKASDGKLDSNTATVTVTVTAVNDAPVAQADSAQTNEDTPVTISVLANDSDIDKDALSIAKVGTAGHGQVIISGTAVTYTPAKDYNGTDVFTYTITDGVASTDGTVTVTVLPVNDAPLTTGLAITTAEDTAASATLTATDPDNDTLTFTIVAQPTKGTVNLVDAKTGAILYTPNSNYSGTDSFTFKASDATLQSGTATVAITVTEVNDAPVANAGADIQVEDGVAVSLDASLSFDVEDKTLSYAWTQLSGQPVQLVNPNTAMPIFIAPSEGTKSFTLEFQVAVTDSKGLKDQDSVLVKVNWLNAPPVALAGPEQNAKVGDVVTLDGSLSNDPDDGIKTVLWRQTGGPVVTMATPSALKTTFTVPDVPYPGATLAFELAVTDNSAVKATATTNVKVSTALKAPGGVHVGVPPAK